MKREFSEEKIETVRIGVIEVEVGFSVGETMQ